MTTQTTNHDNRDEYVLDATELEQIVSFIRENAATISAQWSDAERARDTRVFHKTA